MNSFSEKFISACCPHLLASEVGVVYSHIYDTFPSLDLVHAEDVRTIARQLFPEVQETPPEPASTSANVYDLSLDSVQMFSISDLSFTRGKNRKTPPIFNVNEVTIWRWIRKGIFPKPVKIGGKRFWKARDIAKLIQQQASPGKLTDFESDPVMSSADIDRVNSLRLAEALADLEAGQKMLRKIRNPSDDVAMALRDLGMVIELLGGGE